MATLHELVQAQDLEGIRRFLQTSHPARAMVNEADEAGRSPLYYAVTRRDALPEIVECLLQAGADPGFEVVQRWEGVSEEIWKEMNKLLGEMDLSVEQSEKMRRPTEHRESLLSAAIKYGSVTVVEILRSAGADLTYRDANGYTAVLDAVYGDGDRLPMVQYLIGLGLDVNSSSKYNETPVVVAYRNNQFQVLGALLEAGADERPLGWTKLIRAVAIGTPEEIVRELSSETDLDVCDGIGRSAIEVALLKGNLELAKELQARGAQIGGSEQNDSSLISIAAEGGNVEVVRWLAAQGIDVNQPDRMGSTALAETAGRGDLEMVRTLLELGANANAELKYGSILDGVTEPAVVRMLLEHGADPTKIRNENRRALIGLGEPDEAPFREISREQYLRGRYPVEGKANPEDLTDPFKVAMFRAGVNAYRARRRYEDEPTFACGLNGRQASPVWCAERFGQTITLLEDGRAVLVGGEHEDSYDPDFCIYNDVIVVSPDGDVRIYGYPFSTFPATDMHTATLVGDYIYLLGALGYLGERNTDMPVYRLSTSDFRIERVVTSGKDPGRLFDHRATLVDNRRIRVEGGTRITFRRSLFKSKEEHQPNRDVFELDLSTGSWTQK